MISLISKEIDYINRGIEHCSDIPWESIYQQLAQLNDVEQTLQKRQRNRETPLKDEKTVNNSTSHGISEAPSESLPLFTLNLYGNRLNQLSGLPNLSFVRELILSNNRFIACQLPELSNLMNLEALDLSGNQITSMDQLPYLPQLRSFSIAYNLISMLPSLAQSIPNIEKLDLRANRLETSHSLDGLALLPQLRYLQVSNNRVTEISASLARLFSLCPSLISIDEKTQSDYGVVEQTLQTPKLDAYLEKIKSRVSSPKEIVVTPSKQKELEEHYRRYPITASKVLFPQQPSNTTAAAINTSINVAPGISTTSDRKNPWKSKLSPLKEKIKKFRVQTGFSDDLENSLEDERLNEKGLEGDKREEVDQYAAAFANAFLTSDRNEDVERKFSKRKHRSESHQDYITANEKQKAIALENMISVFSSYHDQTILRKWMSCFFRWRSNTVIDRSELKLLDLQSLLQEKEQVLCRLQEEQTKNVSELSKKILQEKAKNSQLVQRIIQQEMIIASSKAEKESLEIQKAQLHAMKEKEVIQQAVTAEMNRDSEESKLKLTAETATNNYNNQKIIEEKEKEISNLLERQKQLILKETDLFNRVVEQENLLRSQQQAIAALENEKALLLHPPTNPQDMKQTLIDQLQREVKELQSLLTQKHDEYQVKERKSLETERTLLQQYQQLFDKYHTIEQSFMDQKQQTAKVEARLLTLQTAFEELSSKYEIAINERNQLEEKQQKSMKTIKELGKCVKKLQQITDYRQKQEKEAEEQLLLRNKACENCGVLQQKIDSYDTILQKVQLEKQSAIQENQRLVAQEQSKEQEYHSQLMKQVETMEQFMKEIEQLKAVLQLKESTLQQYQQNKSHSIEKYNKQVYSLKQRVISLENELEYSHKEMEKKDRQLTKRKEIEKRIKKLIHHYLSNNAPMPFSYSSFLNDGSSVAWNATPIPPRSPPSSQSSQQERQNLDEKDRELEFYNLLQSIDNSGLSLSDRE